MPPIGPNLADDQDLCKDVIRYVYTEFFYPYLTNRQRFDNVWKNIDRTWRCLTENSQLDYDPFAERSAEWLKRQKDSTEANAAQITPSDFYQQTTVLSAMAYGLSWRDGVPARFIKPSTLSEHPLYNPAQQAIDAANERLGQEAKLAKLSLVYRQCYPDFLKFGHTWGFFDYDRQFEIMPDGVPVPKTFYTRAEKLNPDQVLVDMLIPVRPIERQPCPIVRRMISRYDLYDNELSNLNPFGWTNIDQAISDNTQYALSQEDMNYVNLILKTRYGVTDASGGQNPKETIKQLYSAYVKLALFQDPKTGKVRLSSKDGIETQDANGKTIRVYPRPKRYIVEWYGYPNQGGATCLRIQLNPTPKDKIPLRCVVHKIEDTVMAIPISLGEITYGAMQQLSTAVAQFIDSKNYTINRPWITSDPGLASQNLNKPGKNIEVDDINSVKRADGTNYDDTATLLPMMQYCRDEIKNICGGKDTLLGEVSSGRRAASDVMSATDAARTPVITDVDSFNDQFIGAYAEFMLDNLNAWGDRDWIRKKTGLEYFPNMEIQTSMAKEFVDKMVETQNVRYFVETFGNNPMFAQYLNTPEALTLLARKMGISGIEQVINDGGYRVTKDAAMRQVTQILGEGIPIPPSPDDNDQMFIEIFMQAMKDPYWQTHAPQNLPLMQQRIQIQQQQFMIKQMQEMAMQASQMALQDQEQGGGGNGKQGQEKAIPQTPGGVAQGAIGAVMG